MAELSSEDARSRWINAFVAEWVNLAEGKADHEELIEIAATLYRVNGDQAPEMVAAKHFNSFPDTEDAVRDPEAAFTDLAAELGIIKRGDRLDDVQMEFAYGVVELCAAIGDHYGDRSHANAGEHIRALYGPV